MRFLHTSDWHVGKTIGGRSRAAEHRAVLAEILDIGRRAEADCLLVTGDVFESAAPGAEAEEIVYEFFRDLSRAGIPAVVIAGNHDHERKLAAIACLLEVVNVTVRHDLKRPDAGGIVYVTAKSGEKAAIGAVPFIPEHKMIRAEELMLEEAVAFQEYAQRLARVFSHHADALAPHPIRILMGHLHVDRATLGGGERALHIGQTYAVPAPTLPSGLHYLALGHIHRPQEVPTPSPGRYAGSPLALDFGEVRQEKSVVLVEVSGPRRPARLETIPLRKGRALRDVRGTLTELEAIARSDKESDDYLRVFVAVEAPVPGLADEVRRLFPNAVQVHLDPGKTTAAASEEAGASRLAPGGDPTELYATYHRRKHRADPPRELLALFRELFAAATAGDDGDSSDSGDSRDSGDPGAAGAAGGP